MLDPFAKYKRTPLSQHMADFIPHVRTAGACAKYVEGLKHKLEKALGAMEAVLPTDLSTDRAEKFLLCLVEEDGLSAKTRNAYLAALIQFAEWGVKRGRWPSNPFKSIAKLNEDVDVRRQRRALSEQELRNLVAAAKVRASENFRQQCPNASATTLSRLKRTGLERSLIYKMAALTGLRRKELKTLEWGHLSLDTPATTVTVEAKNAKGKREDTVPIHIGFAEELRQWRALRMRELGRPVEAGDRVFHIAHRLLEQFEKDCAYAGIRLKDGAGRIVDFHSLRHTFSTLLSRAGVSPRVAQSLMRHADITTTMKTYTHVELMDRVAAVSALPALWDTVAQADMGVAAGAESLHAAAPMHMPKNLLLEVSSGDASGQIVENDGRPSNRGLAAVCAENGGICQLVTAPGREHARQDSNLQPSDSKSVTLSN